MFIFKFLWGVFQSLVTMGVLGISIDFYDPTLLAYEIPPFIEQMVWIGVIWVSLFWAVLHLVGGGLFGLAASGVGDGLKMGLLLGAGMGICRLWPHCLSWAVGNIVGQGPMWHAVILVIVALILFSLSSTMRYFWSTVQNGAFGRE